MLPLISVGDREMGNIWHLKVIILQWGIFFYTAFLLCAETSSSGYYSHLEWHVSLLKLMMIAVGHDSAFAGADANKKSTTTTTDTKANRSKELSSVPFIGLFLNLLRSCGFEYSVIDKSSILQDELVVQNGSVYIFIAMVTELLAPHIWYRWVLELGLAGPISCDVIYEAVRSSK